MLLNPMCIFTRKPLSVLAFIIDPVKGGVSRTTAILMFFTFTWISDHLFLTFASLRFSHLFHFNVQTLWRTKLISELEGRAKLKGDIAASEHLVLL